MPRLSSWFIRSSLIYLGIGFTFGALILANKGISFWPSIWRLLPLHAEFLLHGWFIQLAMGVAFWILPRFSQGAGRGNEHLSWIAWLLVNLGIGFVVLNSLFPGRWWVTSARLAELSGIVSFVIGNWKRVRPTRA